MLRSVNRLVGFDRLSDTDKARSEKSAIDLENAEKMTQLMVESGQIQAMIQVATQQAVAQAMTQLMAQAQVQPEIPPQPPIAPGI